MDLKLGLFHQEISGLLQLRSHKSCKFRPEQHRCNVCRVCAKPVVGAVVSPSTYEEHQVREPKPRPLLHTANIDSGNNGGVLAALHPVGAQSAERRRRHSQCCDGKVISGGGGGAEER